MRDASEWPVQVSVNLPAELHTRVEREAKRLNLSKSAYIRRCIESAMVRGNAW